MNALTRALIPVALMLVTGWHAPAEAAPFTAPAWLYQTADQSMVYSIGDGYLLVFYPATNGNGTTNQSVGIQWGYYPGGWFAGNRGVDEGQPSTFLVTYLDGELTVIPQHDLRAPRRERGRK